MYSTHNRRFLLRVAFRSCLAVPLRVALPSLLACLCCVVLLTGISAGQEDPQAFPHAINTQAEGEHPPTPLESLAMMDLPQGFHATLFAGEPDVRQPIAFDFDDRGRLWVAECYTYEGGEYDLKKKDRILIFEDADNDGTFDSRKVFWDEGERLTGITIGFGGVWITSAPNLLFLPDRDRDDVPDGRPEVKLEGFSLRARHNMVNGLRWGPEGWLYGRHGITDTSTVGTPSTPLGRRPTFSCSIWRYHPVREEFEIVTNGTTNPWGLDYDDHGQWFFTNNVINHLWHVVPGAHYQRMFGSDLNPYVYRLIEPTADHFHWDTAGGTGTATNANRQKYDGRHDSFGGGHSHVGAMIYLADNWPAEYRGKLLTCNTHGRRVNVDVPRRKGNSYTATHDDDFLIANNGWFRGLELKYGPDGAVYLTDWSDQGECHDHDGVHRTSGRIIKISHQRRSPADLDLQQGSDEALVALQLNKNDWFVRRARRILQERALAGRDMTEATELLLAQFKTQKDVTRRLRALWALYSIGATNEEWLRSLLAEENEHLRSWALRLLVDSKAPNALEQPTIERMQQLAVQDESGLVRLFLASALQRIPIEQRLPIASALAAHAEDAADRMQPLMIWYGIESAVLNDVPGYLKLAGQSQIPLLRKHIARRIVEQLDDMPDAMGQLLALMQQSPTERLVDYLSGMEEALQGLSQVKEPEGWDAIQGLVENKNDAQLLALVRELSVVFGDGRAIAELLALARNQTADTSNRIRALQAVVDARPDGLKEELLRLRSDRVVGAVAIRAMSRFEDPSLAKNLIRYLPGAKHDHRAAIFDSLVSRASFATMLLEEVKAGKVDPAEITVIQATNIVQHQDSELTGLLEQVWGTVRKSTEEKEQFIQLVRKVLDKVDNDLIDPKDGRRVFAERCGSCHRLFGEGTEVGPGQLP
ncbi:MAG: PVC-type heme-binding CxxCH protein [Planctomycetota bacterium]